MGLQHVFAITTRQNLKALALLDRLGFVQIKDENAGFLINRASLSDLDKDELLYILK